MVCFDDTERDPADKYDADTLAFLATFASYATKNYGKRCDDTEPGCHCCDLWALYDQVEKLIKI